MQGGFRENEFPQVALDRSSTSSTGTVYVIYSEGAAIIAQDLPIVIGTYAHSDGVINAAYMGGYDAFSSDFLSKLSGFLQQLCSARLPYDRRWFQRGESECIHYIDCAWA